MKVTTVIINEQHSLLPEQESILQKMFGEWETLSIPAEGWSYGQILNYAREQFGKAPRGTWEEPTRNYVFVSPVPLLIRELTRYECTPYPEETYISGIHVYVFHNDRREKRELPDGRVISVVAKEGWLLV